MDQACEKLFKGNEEWVQRQLASDKQFFENHAKGQSPEFLWIGCSDSRVPVSDVTKTTAGDIFVHRNIANLVIYTDFNLMAVLQYAVEALKVKHIVVCGHYGCGGVTAALKNNASGIIGNWVQHIRETAIKNDKLLSGIASETDKVNKLVELNVKQQVSHLAQTSIVQNAWKERELTIHGWVYDLASGKLKDLDCDLKSVEQVPTLV